MGRYGPTVALPRILETYRRLGLKQSFFVPAWVMDYPEMVEEVLNDGHEIGHHGHLHEDPARIPADEQQDWFERALQVHSRVTGTKFFPRPDDFRLARHDRILPTVSKAGDSVTFLAEMDSVIVLSACPMDLNDINGRPPTAAWTGGSYRSTEVEVRRLV